MRPVAYFSILAVCAAGISCGPASPPSGPARIHFSEVSKELGEISIAPTGRNVEFPFVNRGLSVLRVTHLVTKCGCIDAAVDQSEVAPGATGMIVVRIAPVVSEERKTSVAVHSDDAANPIVRLHLSWRAVAPLDTDPVLLDFGVVLPHAPVERIVRLRRPPATSHDMPCSVTRVDCRPTETLRAELEEAGGEGMQPDVQRLRVTLTPGAEAGQAHGTVTLDVDQCWQPRISIPVQWRVQDVIEATPSGLFLGAGNPGEICSRSVVFSARAGHFLEIERIELDEADAALKVQLNRSGDNRIVAKIQLALPESAGDYRNEFMVYCTKPEVRVLNVPVSAFVVRSAVENPEKALRCGNE